MKLISKASSSPVLAMLLLSSAFMFAQEHRTSVDSDGGTGSDPEATAQPEMPDSARSVKVVWQRSLALKAEGISRVVVLNPVMCSASLFSDGVTLTGIGRGETLMFVWFGDRRENWLVQIVDPPLSPRAPGLGYGADGRTGSGMIGSTVQTAFGTNQAANYVISSRVFWTETALGGRLSINSSFQNVSATGTPSFNVNSASILYSRNNLDVALLDSALDFTGGQGSLNRFSQFGNLSLRGFNVNLRRENTQYQFFGGSTIPYVYTRLADTRDLFGMNYIRKISSTFTFMSTSAMTNVPEHLANGTSQRKTDFFEMAATTWKPTSHVVLQGTGGFSNAGFLGLFSGSYTTERFSGSGSFARSGADFPLNKVMTLVAGENSLSAGTTYQFSHKLLATGYFQHVYAQGNSFGGLQGKSDYVNPSISYLLAERHRLFVNYLFSLRQDSPVIGSVSNQRIDANYSAQYSRFTNTFQTSYVRNSDLKSLQSQTSFSYGDSVSLKLGQRSSISAGFTSFHSNLSPANQLYQQIGLLPPVLQQLFLADPVAFMQSINFTPQLQSILADLQPASSQVTVSGEFPIGKRMNISPFFNFSHLTQGTSQNSNTHQFGYSLSYRLTDSLQLTSNLTTLYLLDSTSATGVRRTTVLSMGFNKSLSGSPRQLLPFHMGHYTVRGRVFRDMNLNGVYNAGESGLEGIEVTLSNGDTAMTDPEGRYEFSGVGAGKYELAVSLAQFHEAVRVTSPTNRFIAVGAKRTTETDFGIVNFARVSGLVFNDYLNEGKREQDAVGLPAVKITLKSAVASREIITEPGGDFEVTDIAPGNYEVIVDRSTLPPNYLAPAENAHVHVAPTASVVQDIAIRAVRSISGRVLLKTKVDGKEQLSPVRDVQLTADYTIATTDNDGNFVLRNLPAGELTLSFVARKPLKEGVQLPSGKFKVTREPMQIQNAVIVISNPDLLQYLIP
ncbi:MAG: hypothetical protein JWO20_717 [Candidatus Angelobacter sp.]|nr:hypothetical protein [Candidatus Angelobacter sp.]